MRTRAINTCPAGGKHVFVIGRCYKCSLSIRVHQEKMKENNRAKWRLRYHAPKNKTVAHAH